MNLIHGNHPSIIQENIRTLRSTGMGEHQAIHHAHAHAHMTGAPEMTSAGADGEPAVETGHVRMEMKAPPHSGVDPTGSGMEDPKGGSGIHIKPSHEGKLHEKLGVPAGEKIPEAKLAKAKNSDSAALRKEATFAENAKHFQH